MQSAGQCYLPVWQNHLKIPFDMQLCRVHSECLCVYVQRTVQTISDLLCRCCLAWMPFKLKIRRPRHIRRNCGSRTILSCIDICLHSSRLICSSKKYCILQHLNSIEQPFSVTLPVKNLVSTKRTGSQGQNQNEIAFRTKDNDCFCVSLLPSEGLLPFVRGVACAS